MNSISSTLLILSLALLGASASLADASPDDELSRAMRLQPDTGRGEEIFDRLCSQCHGKEAWGSYSGEFPQLAGQHRSVIIKQLADIRSGKRDNPIMYPIARESVMGGPQAISDVAAYVAGLPMDPDPDVGEGEELLKGKALYEERCNSCHRANGEGNEEHFYPLIGGQHFEYLLRQLILIRDGKRRNAHPGMSGIISQMSDRELEIIADYVSRLIPPVAHSESNR